MERLRTTQNELNKQGASDLVVELFMSESPINILEESVNLAIALLEGGNTEVQVNKTFVHLYLHMRHSVSLCRFRPAYFGIYIVVNQHRRNSSKSSTTRCSTHRRL